MAKMSANGLRLLKQWEGVVLHVYKDSAGLDTIGVGHLITPVEKKTGFINIAGNRVDYARGITESQAMSLLAQDVIPAENAVNAAVKTIITQNQFDALVSFAFNVGCGGFRSSTALKMINTEQFDKVPEWLAKWNKASGEVNDGLIVRRRNEIKLWLA
jgi:lysozyme